VRFTQRFPWSFFDGKEKRITQGIRKWKEAGMLLWSRGLGQTEVYMDFRQYRTIQDPDSGNVLVVGKMQSPVTWEFVITMQPEDIAGVMKSFFTLPMIRFVARNLFQYVVFLLKRKTYKVEDEDFVPKIRKSYLHMVKKQRIRAA